MVTVNDTKRKEFGPAKGDSNENIPSLLNRPCLKTFFTRDKYGDLIFFLLCSIHFFVLKIEQMQECVSNLSVCKKRFTVTKAIRKLFRISPPSNYHLFVTSKIFSQNGIKTFVAKLNTIEATSTDSIESLTKLSSLFRKYLSFYTSQIEQAPEYTPLGKYVLTASIEFGFVTLEQAMSSYYRFTGEYGACKSHLEEAISHSQKGIKLLKKALNCLKRHCKSLMTQEIQMVPILSSVPFDR